jgi:hypothetical protein
VIENTIPYGIELTVATPSDVFAMTVMATGEV